MRVDRSENRVGFFDNMGDRPITLGEWQYYEIVGDVEEDAATVNIGMLLLGKGEAGSMTATADRLCGSTGPVQPACHFLAGASRC